MNKLKNGLRILLTLIILLIGLVAWVQLPWQGLIAVLVLIGLWMLLTRSGRQAASITGIGISTLGQRIGASAVIVIGIAGVVAVLVALFSMAEGYRATLASTGSADSVIVLRGASAAEVMSTLSRDSINVIEQVPGIARDADGRALASAETVTAVNLPIKGGLPDEDGSAQFRGVENSAWRVHDELKIIEGRRFESGKREVIAGSGAQRQFVGLNVGQQIRLGSDEWTVVGIFHAGNAFDSEIWADANMVADAYRRGSTRNSVTAKLTDAAAFQSFKDSLTSDPRLQVDVSTTAEYYAAQSSQMHSIIRIMGIVVGGIMAIGAIFGAINTMFASVAARAQEIATLRAIGFKGTPVVTAVMLETLLLALLGGVLGGVLAWLVFNGYTASTIAGGVGQLTFEFKVTPELIWSGLKWALGIGLIGGLFPALRAARLPVATALRAA